MNTKASSSHEVIARHFARHPHVNYVYATDEAADSAARAGLTVIDGVSGSVPVTNQPVVVRTGVSESEYRRDLAEFVAHQDSSIAGWFDGEGVIEVVPWVTLGLLTFRALRRHQSGLKVSDNKRQTLRDSVRSGAALGTATLLQGVGVPLPVSLIGSTFSVAVVNGVVKVRDDWASLIRLEESFVSRVESLAVVR
jgi:hypothetical protein